jgi:single-strand DNA-binding protein
MAGSLNKVMLIGNLGRDPEVRATQNGQKIANMTLATSDSRYNKATGQRDEHTEWHRLVMFGNQAEVAEKYLKKGKTIFVEGRIQTRKWTDKENQERTTVEIVVDQFTMLGGARDGEMSGSSASYDSPARVSGGGGSAPAPKKISEEAPFDDEIPF